MLYSLRRNARDKRGRRDVPIENHAVPTPETCDICEYVVEHPEAELRREHGLVNLASTILIG